MRRADQFVLIGSAVPLAWLAMMAVHEAGHVLGARLTGGTLKVLESVLGGEYSHTLP
jgi:hypothetical protein